MGDKQLFSKFKAAVNDLMECCEPNVYEIPPIARSEVYNETWMLRLTLALLHDSELDFSKIEGGKKQIALKSLRDSLQRNWISEGGLAPVFKREGTTWADAILGDVKRKQKTKRGIEAADTPVNPCVGIVVVEAKMGSLLSPGTDHYPDYNQAARNIACLANLVKDNAQLVEKTVFVVLAPKEIIAESQKLITDAPKVIGKIDKSETRETRNLDDNFWKAVQQISEKSVAMSWEEVSHAIICEEKGRSNLLAFYDEAKKVMLQR